ncbi:MAG: hypothetical protein A3A10_01930 [Candidatus Tagabacteria bacterium RIFCSPLOWO2_01_FULL_42_9]|uniref:Uncharacterized protein n=1 Tax=Candidatus Tagabacteria bacterium RIFCSPLOWO2_01_FULL_42_9 TaxID=1802296 RepID=A0A1G2LVP0_9BACT|nr:MAG: hypothetical protein A3A10_01930 [Candidatus Tagabacteria bacterium RIFCSPLOWO2_01_FULL_42_9]
MRKTKTPERLKKLFWINCFAGISLFLARSALALENPLASSSFAELISNIAEIVAQIGTPVAVIAIIWAGFLFATAQGNEEKINTAKRTFFWAIIGTAILLGAWTLSTAIEEFMLSL